MIFTFWVSIFIIFNTFAGYGILLFLLVLLKRKFWKNNTSKDVPDTLPHLTLVVAAYNEEDLIEQKIENSLSLNYAADKLSLLFVTDGSNDRTAEKVSGYAAVRLMHQPQRLGKINAMHRAMQEVTSEVTVFSDANTILNKDALLRIARHYADKRVGAVSGEKRVQVTEKSDATAGEGFYWKYESKLKKWDSELYSVVGAAGELFSIRTALYQPVEADTILDDFMISLRITRNGYRIVYEPDAFALEQASADTKEELKRKIRIAAGGIQSIGRLKFLLNPLRNPLLSFQYISHRVLRWTITPFLLVLAFLLNVAIVMQPASPMFYQLLLGMQVVLYVSAFGGWYFQRKQIKVKLLFVPYYFCLMNYAVIMGIGRFMFKGQSAAWEKAQRKK